MGGLRDGGLHRWMDGWIARGMGEWKHRWIMDGWIEGLMAR